MLCTNVRTCQATPDGVNAVSLKHMLQRCIHEVDVRAKFTPACTGHTVCGVFSEAVEATDKVQKALAYRLAVEQLCRLPLLAATNLIISHVLPLLSGTSSRQLSWSNTSRDPKVSRVFLA